MPYAPCQLRRIAAGLCIECESPAQGKRRCAECYAKSYDRHEKWRQANLAKDAEYSRQWRERNPEKARVSYARQYAKKDKAKEKQYLAVWREANRPKLKEYSSRAHRKLRSVDIERARRGYREQARRWRALNPERNKKIKRDSYHQDIELGRHKNAEARRRRESMRGRHTRAEWLARVAYYGWRCRWCTKELTVNTLTKDHVIAVAVGGTDWASNLVPACKSCNSSKGTRRQPYPPLNRKTVRRLRS